MQSTHAPRLSRDMIAEACRSVRITVTVQDDGNDAPAVRSKKVHHCMLAHPFDAARLTGWPVAVEPKLDGVRVLAHVDVARGEVIFRSRNGNAFPSLDHLQEPILRAVSASGYSSIVLDGEVVGESFARAMGQVRQQQGGASDVGYWLFDALLPTEYSGGISAAYQVRRQRVENICAGAQGDFNAVTSTLCSSLDEVQATYRDALRAGQEGVMVKPLSGRYERKRSYAFMKIKQLASEDLRVVRAIPGKGKCAGTLGALICLHGQVEVRVGTGFTDAERDELWQQHQAEGLAGRIAEIGYHQDTESGSLRHPRFIRWRDMLVHGVKE